MNVLGVITARAGSQRIKGKNSKLLNGLPLLAYTINAAKESQRLSRFIVSTDAPEMADLARQFGAEVPFLRPKNISGDHAKSSDAIKHALDYFASQNENYDAVVLLQPTSPLRTGHDIDQAILLLDSKFDAVVSVCKSEHSPLWMNTLPDDFSMKDFLSHPALKTKRSQDLSDYYRLNGAVFAAKTTYFIANDGFYGSNTRAYIMPQERSIDIDTDWDFYLAESLLSRSAK